MTTAGAPLRLVDPHPPDLHPLDPDPFGPDPLGPDRPGAEFPPEVRAVLDAVATLHRAVVEWVTTAAPAGAGPARHTAGPATGRHRR